MLAEHSRSRVKEDDPSQLAWRVRAPRVAPWLHLHGSWLHSSWSHITERVVLGCVVPCPCSMLACADANRHNVTVQESAASGYWWACAHRASGGLAACCPAAPQCAVAQSTQAAGDQVNLLVSWSAAPPCSLEAGGVCASAWARCRHGDKQLRCQVLNSAHDQVHACHALIDAVLQLHHRKYRSGVATSAAHAACCQGNCMYGPELLLRNLHLWQSKGSFERC